MADHDAEGDSTSGEQLPVDTLPVQPFLGRIQLYLVLKTECPSVPIDDQRGEARSVVDETLGSEHDSDAGRRCRRGDVMPGAR
jgi:hypothetical protein